MAGAALGPQVQPCGATATASTDSFRASRRLLDAPVPADMADSPMNVMFMMLAPAPDLTLAPAPDPTLAPADDVDPALAPPDGPILFPAAGPADTPAPN